MKKNGGGGEGRGLISFLDRKSISSSGPQTLKKVEGGGGGSLFFA